MGLLTVRIGRPIAGLRALLAPLTEDDNWYASTAPKAAPGKPPKSIDPTGSSSACPAGKVA